MGTVIGEQLVMLPLAFVITLLGLCRIPSVESHGRLMGPPSRASEWRFGFDNPPDYNDNQGFCGGFGHQQEQGGKCGICGDPYDGPLEHEAPGGKYANGNIVATYSQGEAIEVAVELTTNHKGHFNYRLCPNNNIHQDPKQDCFDAHMLELTGDHHGTELHITEWTKGYWNATVQLPTEITCDQCILQWTYTAGNSWGTSPNGTSCTGCGPQEWFRACADIAIVPSQA